MFSPWPVRLGFGILIVKPREVLSIMERLTHVEHAIVVLCTKGCRQVWQEIIALEKGEVLPETRGLNSHERAMVLQELRSIMAVYGDRCTVD